MSIESRSWKRGGCAACTEIASELEASVRLNRGAAKLSHVILT